MQLSLVYGLKGVLKCTGDEGASCEDKQRYSVVAYCLFLFVLFFLSESAGGTQRQNKQTLLSM